MSSAQSSKTSLLRDLPFLSWVEAEQVEASFKKEKKKRKKEKHAKGLKFPTALLTLQGLNGLLSQLAD